MRHNYYKRKFDNKNNKIRRNNIVLPSEKKISIKEKALSANDIVSGLLSMGG